MPDPKKYVVGFFMDIDLERVILLRKNRPDWQVGKLNGVGGAIEPDESVSNAMAREFEEETGHSVAPVRWVLFNRLTTDHGTEIFFLAARAMTAEEINLPFTVTDEQVCTVPLLGNNWGGMAIPNLAYLIPMARHCLGYQKIYAQTIEVESPHA